MALTLWDVMRPTALLGGASAAASIQLTFGITAVIASGLVGLAAGLAAFRVSTVAAERMPHDASEASFRALYVVTFMAICAAAFLGGWLGARALHAIA
jgi:hypothetical protein